jgi:hypothetical protein
MMDSVIDSRGAVFEDNVFSTCGIFHCQDAAWLWFQEMLNEGDALTGASKPTVWRSCPVIWYFDKKEHFASTAAGACGDIDTG